MNRPLSAGEALSLSMEETWDEAENEALLRVEETREEEDSQSLLLVTSLLRIVNDITLLTDFHQSHKRECLNLVRRIKLLQPLFEDMKEAPPHSTNPAVAIFKTLKAVLQSAKALLQSCIHGSKIYLVVEHEAIVKHFNAVSDQMDKALKGLPWNLLNVSEDVREQVDLVHGQFSRAKGRADLQESQLYMNIRRLLSQEDQTVFDATLLRELADRLQLKTHMQREAEFRALQELIRQRSPEVDKALEQMLHLLNQIKIPFSGGDRDEENRRPEMSPSSSGTESSCRDVIPDDYLCPISLEVMKDPVIIATGQTYERINIQKWLMENRTCPKTLQVLPHTTLIPNFVLRSLINQWCEANGLEVPAIDSSYAARDSSGLLSRERGTIDALVQQLCSGQTDLQRAAAAELRLLTKDCVENRLRIAEAGAIPHLVTLLSTSNDEVQENAVTALLNLSIHEHIKGAVVQAGAIPSIVKVLKCGSMSAQENAAATLFLLSSVNENKLTIGALGAIPPLVDLLRNGNPQGRKDAASALFNLLIYQGNKPRAVRAGVVKPIISLLTDSSIGMRDEALSILAILATHQEGRRAIGRAFVVPVLIGILQNGTPRSKENAAAILLALSLDNPQHLSTAGRMGVKGPLEELCVSGTERAKRKASNLLEHLAMLQAD